MKKFVAIFLIFIIAAGAGGYLYLQSKLGEKIPHAEDVQVKIPKGTSLAGCIDILNMHGILRPDWLFENYARVKAKFGNKSIIAGYYNFPPGFTNKDVLDAIFSGSSLDIVRVTLPEGYSYTRYMAILAEKVKLNEAELLRFCRSDSLLNARNIPADNVEGYLLPETYEFFRRQPENEVLDRILNAQESFWTDSRFKKARELGYNRHEILTLASIIEAESPVVDERARISGVYHNRLERGMLLQADPTVQYAIGEKRRLLYRDLEVNDPYNTYKFTGLPPGPINNPAKSAIIAALNPEDHNFLYFVAVGDGTGRHNFAKTLAQHNIYKQLFRRNVRR